jgi:hypothetical protein
MPKKKRMKKAKMKKGKMKAQMKKAQLKPWILGNNPDDNNKCQCFKNKLPTAKWIAINSFSTQAECTKFVGDCSSFFMKMPLTPAKKMLRGRRRRLMGMGMGMMG